MSADDVANVVSLLTAIKSSLSEIVLLLFLILLVVGLKK